MRRALRSSLAVISVLFIVATTATSSLAADYSRIGVRAGDQANYSVSYYSVSPYVPESEYISDSYNKIHIDVSGTIGTNVTLHITYFYPDQRTQTEIYNADISRQGCYYLTVAGLEVGDPVFIGAYITVKETIVMTILGTPRFVNVVELSRALDAEIVLYYEKETGILVESRRSSLLFGWMVERITSTSPIPTNEANPVTSMVTVVVSVAIAATIVSASAIMNRRRRN